MDQHIAVLADQLAQTVALVADDDGSRTGHVSLVHGDGAFTGCTEDPDAALLQVVDGVVDVGDAGDLHVLHGTGGSLCNGGSQTNAAALGDDDAVGACTLGRTHDSAQVVGIAQLVADDDQGSLTTGSCLLQDLVDGGVLVGSSQGDDALMGTGEGHLVQLAAVNRNDDGAGFLGLSSQTLQAAVGVALCNEDLVDGTACLQRLGQGVATLQLTLNFLHDFALREAVGTAGTFAAVITLGTVGAVIALEAIAALSIFIHK